MKIVVGVFGAELAVSFRSSGVGLNARIKGSFGQPTCCLGTVKTVWVDGWMEIVHVCCLHNIA